MLHDEQEKVPSMPLETSRRSPSTCMAQVIRATRLKGNGRVFGVGVIARSSVYYTFISRHYQPATRFTLSASAAAHTPRDRWLV
jgi:hypothetical protein